MKNIIKKSLYTTAWILLSSPVVLATTTSSLKSTIKSTGSATALENWTWDWFIETIQNIISYAAWLLYLIAVVFALYGWFQILTAWGDDGKVKKGKTTLINAALWLAAIFLASTVINWVIWLFGNQGQIVT